MMPAVTLSPLNRTEVLRYLGMTEAAADADFRKRLDKCEEKLLHQARPRFTYCIVPLILTEHVLFADTVLLEGKEIRQHIGSCEQAILLAATLGIQADLLVDRTQKRDLTNALILDALANAAVEQVCDQAEQFIHETIPERFFTWRFSPGYGDFPLSAQTALLSRLNAARMLGITTTDTFLMTPKKSVTAIIGCSKQPLPKRQQGCMICNLRETCPYRKKGVHCGGSETTSEA